jgi:HEPN domain-containing protein
MEKVSAAKLLESDRREFFNTGIQYYAAARMLFFAGGAPVTGNLAHHAVEMLLKGALCRTVPIKTLAHPPFSHSLTNLWARFKTEMEDDATLARFGDTIDALDPWETLRYPDQVRGFDLRLSIIPPPPTPHMPPLCRPSTERVFQLVLPDLDALVAYILVKASVRPVGLALNHEGLAALARENATGFWPAHET